MIPFMSHIVRYLPMVYSCDSASVGAAVNKQLSGRLAEKILELFPFVDMVYQGIGRHAVDRAQHGAASSSNPDMKRVCAIAYFCEASSQSRSPAHMSLERHMRDSVEALKRRIKVVNAASNDGAGVLPMSAGTMQCLDMDSVEVDNKLALCESKRGDGQGGLGKRARGGDAPAIARHCWLRDSVGAYHIVGISATACAKADIAEKKDGKKKRE